jgi:GntR family transcriptional repressor for pyruvate dehydrogenase complex
MTTDTVGRSTLVDDTCNKIREMILTGQIAPGENLPTRKQLSERFGVGLSTIHEAIQVLTAIGLVEARPGRGTWVQPDALDGLVNPAHVRARLGHLDTVMLHEARSLVEIGTSELAAQRATPEEMQQIWDSLRTMEETIDDIEAFVAADLQFHMTVAKASKNILLQQFYHLSRKLMSSFILEYTAPRWVREAALTLQGDIARAIEQRNPAAAREAAIAHMQHITTLIDHHTHGQERD